MRNPFALRAKLYRSIVVFGTWYTLAKMDDDKLTWRDAPETLALAAGFTWIWWDTALAITAVSSTPLVVVEAAVVTGLVASVAIGGLEGGEKYIDYINPLNYPEHVKDPEKIEALVQASDITMSLINPLYIPQKMLAEWIVEDLPWGEVFKNRWVTGPSLPF